MLEIKHNIDAVCSRLKRFEAGIPVKIHAMLTPEQWNMEFRVSARDALMEIATPEERDMIDTFVDAVTTEVFGKTGIVASVSAETTKVDSAARAIPTKEQVADWVMTPFEEGGKDLTLSEMPAGPKLIGKLNAIIYKKYEGWEGLAKRVHEFVDGSAGGSGKTSVWLKAILQKWLSMVHERMPPEMLNCIRLAWSASA